MTTALVLGLVGVGLLMALGIWQVRRLAWKEALLARIEARIAADPVAVPVTPDPEVESFLPVTAHGRLPGNELYVLASTRSAGAVYRVISVLATDSGRRIMVDRGVIATTARGAAAEMAGFEVTGNLRWPQEVDGFTPEPDTGAGIWFARDVPRMAAALHAEPVLIVARAASPTDPPVAPLPVTIAGIPNNHLQYAITWFSLAAVWAGMTGYLLWRIRRKAI